MECRQCVSEYTYDFFDNHYVSNFNFKSAHMFENPIGTSIIEDVPVTVDEKIHHLQLLDQHINIPFKSIIMELNGLAVQQGLTFRCFTKLHSETITLNSCNDIRRYGYIRFVLDDRSGNKHAVESSVFQDKKVQSPDQLYRFGKELISEVSNIRSFMRHERWNKLPVVFTQQATGFFVHEILGHMLEEDIYRFSERYFSNKKFPKSIKIVDDIRGYEDYLGLNHVDDNGEFIKPITLLENGCIQNIISTNTNYGLSRRENLYKDILPRMRCTYLIGQENLSDNVIPMIGECILVSRVYAGACNFVQGTFRLNGDGFVLKNGLYESYISNLVITGDSVEWLNDINLVGKDIKIFGTYCDKLGNIIRVGVGGPSILLSRAEVCGDVYGYI